MPLPWSRHRLGYPSDGSGKSRTDTRSSSILDNPVGVSKSFLEDHIPLHESNHVSNGLRKEKDGRAISRPSVYPIYAARFKDTVDIIKYFVLLYKQIEHLRVLLFLDTLSRENALEGTRAGCLDLVASGIANRYILELPVESPRVLLLMSKQLQKRTPFWVVLEQDIDIRSW